MRAIVGVDAKDAYLPALCMLARLDFPKLAVTLLHSASPVMPYLPVEAGAEQMQTEYSRAAETEGRQALDRAIDEACALDLQARSTMVFGPAASSIIDVVDQQHVDLVAVAATHHGAWSSSFLGSVSRALAIACPASVLVAKGDLPMPSDLKVVFATDHSPFSTRCLERFIALHPRGVKEILVVSAFEVNDREAEVLAKNLPMLGGDVERWIEEQIEAKNELLCEKLRAAGYKVKSRAVRDNTNDAIRAGMQDSQAHLLVVGSHGKGFIERTFIGSVSLHQVVAEPYPVLVVRP